MPIVIFYIFGRSIIINLLLTGMEKIKNNKALSIAVSIICYIAGIFVAYFTFIILPDSYHFLVKLLIADIAATSFIFLTSVIFNNSSMYDPYWSVKPMVFAFAYLMVLGIENAGLIHWLTFILLQLYGLRLTLNFYRDWPGLKHEDWRYREFRKKFPRIYWPVSFSGIHLFPTIMVYLACLPLYSIFVVNANIDAQIFILSIGAIVLLASIMLAYIADEQMRSFRKEPGNKGKIMDKKLWKHSRHPNYLGEIMTWWGLYIISLSLNFEMWYLGIGALAVNLMFVFVSNPWLDKRSLEKRGNFQDYINRTRSLLPFPKN